MCYVLPCGGTKCVEPLFPDQFWSRHILLSSCIPPHLSFWYCLCGFLSFSWVQDDSKDASFTAETEHVDLSPWQDYMDSKRRLAIYIITPVYCGIFDETRDRNYFLNNIRFPFWDQSRLDTGQRQGELNIKGKWNEFFLCDQFRTKS